MSPPNDLPYSFGWIKVLLQRLENWLGAADRFQQAAGPRPVEEKPSALHP